MAENNWLSDIKLQRVIQRKLADLFTDWNYNEIQTPICHLVDGAPDRLQTLRPEELCRFFDARGNVWVMRPDMTDAIARMVDRELRHEPRPLRLWYIDDVYRRDSAGLFGSTVQAGIELIGLSGWEADRENLLLALHCLRELDLVQTKVAVGHVGLLHDLLNAYSLDGQSARDIVRAMERRNQVQVAEIIQSELSEESASELLARLTRRLTPHELNDETLSFAQSRNKKVIVELIEAASREGFAEQLVFEIGLVGNYSYYTGFVFEIYAMGVAETLGSGGRYDDLLSDYGKPEPAVGFAFRLDSLVQAKNYARRVHRIE